MMEREWWKCVLLVMDNHVYSMPIIFVLCGLQIQSPHCMVVLLKRLRLVHVSKVIEVLVSVTN